MMTDSSKTTTSSAPVMENNAAPLQPAEIRVDTETVDFSREPPPPYTVSIASSAVVVHQPSRIQQRSIQTSLKDQPTVHVCQACGETVLTDVRYVNTRTTHMCAGFICGCGLWCMMCCLGYVPYMLRICKKTKHYCPNCNHLIGEYSKV